MSATWAATTTTIMSTAAGMVDWLAEPLAFAFMQRGMLATVIVGGMIVSAIFTLILMPSVLRLPRVRLPRFARGGNVQGVPADA